MPTPQKRLDSNLPKVALITAAALTVAGVIFFGAAGNHNALAVVVASTVPSLLAAGFAERASRDIRNGTVTEKARQGATEALEETGVIQAVEEGRQTTPAALTALIMLLSDRLELDAEERDTLKKANKKQKARRPTA